MATAQELAQALKYGPQTAGLVRRSAYLEDALHQLQTSGGQNIRSGGELAAKLLATAILSRSVNKANDATLGAIKSDRDRRMAQMMAGISDAPPVTSAIAEPPPPQPAPVPQAAVSPPQPAPVAPQGPQYSDRDVDAMTRMLAGEAIGEGPQGMAAAGHVALTRLKKGWNGARSISDVIYQPHQFTAMSRPDVQALTPDSPTYQQARQVALGVLSGQLPDPTGGAVNYLNPELQAHNGAALPAWAQGPGQRIGRHVFFGGQPGAVQQATQGVPPPPMPPNPNGPADQPAAQPFQLAANGPLQPGMIPAGPQVAPPSAPDRSPPVAGAPPAAPPQAAAGGSPAQSDPWAQRKVLVRRMLMSSDPEEQARGEGEYYKLLSDMAQPTKYDVKIQDGYLIATNPQNPQDRHIQKLDELQVRQGAGPQGLTPGTVGQYEPNGKFDVIQTPQQGYQGAPNQQSYIPGGSADPRAGMNLVNNEGKLRDDYEAQVKPYIAAREGYQKVVQAAGDMSQAGAIALVFGYMKTLDPGSTVREGEQASVQNSGTIPETITNMYNKLLAGKSSLTPEQRMQFANSARGQFEVYQHTFDAANERFGGLAKSYGFDPNRVVRQFKPIEPYKAPPPPAPQPTAMYPGPVAAAHRAMVTAGTYDQNAPIGSVSRPFLARSNAEAQALDKPENKGKRVILPDGSIAVID